MRRFLLAGAFLCAMASSAMAYDPSPTVGVANQMQSTQTCSGITISSGTSVDVIGSTTTYRYVAVQNLDSTADIFCSDNSNVNVTGGAAGNGMDVAKGSPGATVVWSIVIGMHWYCIGTNAAGGNAVACKGR